MTLGQFMNGTYPLGRPVPDTANFPNAMADSTGVVYDTPWPPAKNGAVPAAGRRLFPKSPAPLGFQRVPLVMPLDNNRKNFYDDFIGGSRWGADQAPPAGQPPWDKPIGPFGGAAMDTPDDSYLYDAFGVDPNSPNVFRRR